MIVKTHNGSVRGELIAFHAFSLSNGYNGLDGHVLIRNLQATNPVRPYSTHMFYSDPDGTQYATTGEYDMTLAEARTSFVRRTSGY